jgi:hypothetical protein
MVVNLMTRKINRGARKLIQTPTLIKIKIKSRSSFIDNKNQTQEAHEVSWPSQIIDFCWDGVKIVGNLTLKDEVIIIIKKKTGAGRSTKIMF